MGECWVGDQQHSLYMDNGISRVVILEISTVAEYADTVEATGLPGVRSDQ